MTRGKTAAVAGADDTRTVKAQAVARVLARRKAPKYGEVPDGRGGVVRWQLGDGSELSDPATIAEWADDRLARSAPGTPVSDLLVQIFDRIRVDGARAVPGAVDLAAGLDDGGQFAVFMVLNTVPAGPDGIGTALVREWKRRNLRVMPAASLPVEPTDWNAPSAQAGRVHYRSSLGNPAGPTYTAA